MTDLRSAAEKALEALEWHEEQDEEVRYDECPSRAAMDLLRQALQRPVKSYTNGEPQYATDDVSTKSQNVYTSEERVHESDKSIHDLRAAAEQALKAIRAARESELISEKPTQGRYLDVIGKLEAALAQPEQAPVAWMFEEYAESSKGHMRWFKCMGTQKPQGISEIYRNITPLFTAPPSKPWVSLTNEQISSLKNLQVANRERTATEMAFAVDAKLKELNHG